MTPSIILTWAAHTQTHTLTRYNTRYTHALMRHKSQVPSRDRYEKCSLSLPVPMQKVVVLLINLGVLLVFLIKVGIIGGQDIHGTAQRHS